MNNEIHSSKKICVLIPAYNAEATIASVIKGALKFVPDVIVADDGSEDDTSSIAYSSGAKVIKIPKNRGKGNALKILFEEAAAGNYDAVITMDSDAQHNPEEIPSFIRAYEERPYNIVVGSRMAEKEKIPRARYNSMHVARFYISFAANQFIEDTQCGFRLYPLSVIQNMNLFTERYVTETEILMKAGDAGAEIRFVGVKAIYDNGSESHFRSVIDVAKITAYVISYITIKWLIEGISPTKFTYNKMNSVRDFLSRTKSADFACQVITAFTALPISVLFYLEYLLANLFNRKNFTVIRKLNRGFFSITLATQMLPILLIIAITENICTSIGFKFRFTDRFIQRFYPDLWSR